MEHDVVLVRTAAAPLADLDGHGAAHHVARGEVLGVRRVALHEALARAVGEIAAFAAGTLGDQHAGAVDAGRMELEEFRVLQRHAGAERHGVAVAGAGVGLRGREEGAAIAARRQHHDMRAEAMDRAVLEVPRHHADAGAVLVHDQVEREILDEELGVVLQALLIERVDHGVAGAVGGGAGALRHRAFAVFRGVAAERALIDLALGRARKRHAEMLELDHRLHRVVAHEFDRVLVAEPVGALDRIVEMPTPIVRPHIAERGADAALRRDGVGARRKHLGDAGGLEARHAHAQGRAQARAAGADDDDVVEMIDDRIGGHAQPPSASLSTATMPATASSRASSLIATMQTSLAPSLGA